MIERRRHSIRPYSDRSATIVSTRDARRAGIHAANAATVIRKVRLHKVLVHDYATESTRSITFIEVAPERVRLSGLPLTV